MQIIDWKKFVAVALDPVKKAFAIHIAHFRDKISIHLAYKA